MFKLKQTIINEDDETTISNYESKNIVFIIMKPKKTISENIAKWFRNLFVRK